MKAENNENARRNARPGLPDFIEGLLAGDEKKTLLGFEEYCKANKMAVRLSSGYLWGVYFKGKRVATIQIAVKGMRRGQYMQKDNSWIVGVCYLNAESPEFEKFAAEEKLTETIWANVTHCKGCLKACIGNQPPGVEKRIAGKVFRKACVACGGVSFENPNAEALECVKKMMGMRMRDIASEKEHEQ